MPDLKLTLVSLNVQVIGARTLQSVVTEREAIAAEIAEIVEAVGPICAFFLGIEGFSRIWLLLSPLATGELAWSPS